MDIVFTLIIGLFLVLKQKTEKARLILGLAVILLLAFFLGKRVYTARLATVKNNADWSIQSDYSPIRADSKIATLDEESTLKITDNYPVMDGATALFPVYASFAKALYPESVLTGEEGRVNQDVLTCTTTSSAYRNIVKGEADIVFVADASEEQLAYAEEEGVELVFTPIGREAFVFFVNDKNPISNLSVEEVRKIYSGQIRTWNMLNVKGFGNIRAFQRSPGSGSQTALERLMGDTPIAPPAEKEDVIDAMNGITQRVSDYRNFRNAIGYSFRFYVSDMVGTSGIKLLSLEGVEPTEENIRNGTYPVTGNFYAVTRSDADEEILEVLEWIQGPQGQELIEKTGYTPIAEQ